MDILSNALSDIYKHAIDMSLQWKSISLSMPDPIKNLNNQWEVLTYSR